MQLAKDFDSKKIEGEIRAYLAKTDLRKLIFDSKKLEKIVFIEGPPTMNGTPHAGHLRGRIIKDLWYRYMTLKGHKVVFNAGWDTQGLPVELQAEKELGITGGKTEILKSFGIEKLVNECKRLVLKYNEKWVHVDNLLGMSFNQEDAYWTYKDEFIEREWQFLKKAHETGVLTEGYRVVAYCPSCQTSLSHAEVNQGYDMVQDPSLYYKAKLADEDAYLIVWTTMPFTLITDAMVGLNPDEEYHYVKIENETWVIGQKRLDEFAKEAKIENYQIVKTVKGSEFEGKKYIHPLHDSIPKIRELAKEPTVYVAVAESFVDANTGSGLVHLSPANGEEDYDIARRRNVPIFNPINDEVRFTEDAGRYSGMFVRDADRPIVEDLKAAGGLVRIGRIKHKYPLCWRSHHPIVWLARREFFYMLDRLGDKAIEAAENVEYFFDQPKNRFLGIIKEKHPWCISRERFWGCPLPIWNCKNCGHVERLYSRKEIVEAATDLPDGPNFELHRPWIDRVGIKCKKCQSMMERERFVLDTWHNSGSAPYSSLTDEEYKAGIPAMFLTEGIDQTRGWAYTLLIENVILNNSPVSPFRSFLFQGHVLDKNGNKMSKSVGNVMDAEEMLTKYPVDLIRFYFIWKSSPIEPINFSTDEMMSRPYQILNTLYHIHLYFKQNSEYDKFDNTKTPVSLALQNNLLQAPDRWILSKMQKMIKEIQENNDRCKFHEAARSLEDFVINSLSQIYIPITKAELWDEDNSKGERRSVIYSVLHEVLKTLDTLIHPLCPYTSEYLHLCTFGSNSILLEDWPKVKQEFVDEYLEESFDLMKESVSVSAAARMKAKLKRRWPLVESIICLKKGQKAKIETLKDLLLSQMNVETAKIVELGDKAGLELLAEMQQEGLPAKPIIELERKKIGPKAKQYMGALVAKFSTTPADEIFSNLLNAGSHTFDVGEAKITLDRDDFVVSFDASDGYAFSQRDSLIVFISTARNREMMARGLVKDLARRLQTLRKEKGYNPTDVLDTASVMDLDSEMLDMVKEKSDDLAFLVRVKHVDFTGSGKEYKDDDIDGQKIRISIE
ncbi:isoleucine--tRNA ligase [Candidatus Nitrosotenuis cloacae]|uniref:isoleucine--tRNA ligase n=1 Tax=Candidatus Nitrosotenuis cloacae TaxID=1603555 RepID=UPI002282658A|nr:isoleucine--tRNA ligase [Candidatus Nitrosotenuis cloacae]